MTKTPGWKNWSTGKSETSFFEKIEDLVLVCSLRRLRSNVCRAVNSRTRNIDARI